MGTWASPFTVEKAEQFAAMLEGEHPILPEHAMDRIGGIVGDDRLYDEADRRASLSGPEAWIDFRGHAAAWVAGWMTEGDRHWTTPWEDEAVEICNRAIDVWNETHAAPEWLTIPDFENLFDWDPDLTKRPLGPGLGPR